MWDHVEKESVFSILSSKAKPVSALKSSHHNQSLIKTSWQTVGFCGEGTAFDSVPASPTQCTRTVESRRDSSLNSEELQETTQGSEG